MSKEIVHKSNHYVNNKVLYEAILEHHAKRDELGREPQISRFIGECFLKLCNKLGSRSNFAGYTWRDEMVSDAIVSCVGAFWKFDPKKSTVPFLYFSQVAWNAMVRRINEEKGETYAKHANMEHIFVTCDSLYNELPSSGQSEGASAGVQHHYDVIRNYETAQAKKKLKKKPGARKKKLVKRKLTRKRA